MKKNHPHMKLDRFPVCWGYAPSPVGECLLATIHNRICFFGFTVEVGQQTCEAALRATWRGKNFNRGDTAIALLARRIFAPRASDAPIQLQTGGTAFQQSVWKALQSIPIGTTCSYGEIAAAVGRPTATRATGTAIGQNPIAYLIPCHRVLTASGKVHNYRWGPNLKRALLRHEGIPEKMLPLERRG